MMCNEQEENNLGRDRRCCHDLCLALGCLSDLLTKLQEKISIYATADLAHLRLALAEHHAPPTPLAPPALEHAWALRMFARGRGQDGVQPSVLVHLLQHGLDGRC